MKNLAMAAAGSSPILTLGAIQFMHPSPADWEAVAAGFLDPRFWVTLAVVLLFGAFGGVSHLRSGNLSQRRLIVRGRGRIR